MMNLIDSSAWLAYFTGEKNAKNFEKAINDIEKVIVPTIVIYEVFKKILLEKDKNTAIKYAGHMNQGKVVSFDMPTALSAARISKDFKLAMADSIILATAVEYNATVWTQDSDLKDIHGVKYFKKII